jgi:hypothetical protein
VQTTTGYAGIVIAANGQTSTMSGDDPDDVWRRLCDEAAKKEPSFFGYDGARARFLRIFRNGFASPAYAQQEREYKVAAKEKLDEAVPLETALDRAGLGEAILSVFRATNLLSPFEKTRLQEALRGPRADDFVHGAALFARGEVKRGLINIERALKPHAVANWTAATYLPFLWSPDTQMFLKPEVTKKFASRVGHRFANDYESKLNAGVYESLLDLAAETEREIAAFEPQDRIDVQSFIWVVGEYTVKDEEGVAAGN